MGLQQWRCLESRCVAHPCSDKVDKNSDGKIELHEYLGVILGKGFAVTINGEFAMLCAFMPDQLVVGADAEDTENAILGIIAKGAMTRQARH